MCSIRSREIMNKSRKVASIALALSFVFLGANPTSFAADNNLTAEELGFTDLKVDTTNTAFKSNNIDLHQDENLKAQALTEIKKIRSRLWDENILYVDGNSKNKSTRLQDIAKSYGYKSKEAYVNAIKWSNDLERIAIQRGFEQILTGLSHDRPDGSKYYSTITNNGISPASEILASNTREMNPALSFDQWSFKKSASRNNKSEYDLLIESKGEHAKGNGHLYLILHPSFKYFGYADINNSGTEWNYAVGSFARNIDNNSEKSTGYKGSHKLYVGELTSAKVNSTNKDDTISDEFRIQLEKSIEEAETQINAAEYVLKELPYTVENVKDKLVKIIADTKLIIEESKALLEM